MPPPSRSSPSNPVRLSDQDNGEDGDERDGDSLLNMKKKTICDIDIDPKENRKSCAVIGC